MLASSHQAALDPHEHSCMLCSLGLEWDRYYGQVSFKSLATSRGYRADVPPVTPGLVQHVVWRDALVGPLSLCGKPFLHAIPHGVSLWII